MRKASILSTLLILMGAVSQAQVRPQPDLQQFSAEPEACRAAIEGNEYYNTTTKTSYICTGTVWEANNGSPDRSTVVELMADYLGCATTSCQLEPWFANSSGTGASCQVPNGNLLGTNDFGLLQCDTGTTNAGRGGAVGSTDMWVFGAGESIFETRTYLDDLSDDTEDFTLVEGFSDSVTGSSGTDACAFRYNDNENSGRWVGFCRSNSTESTCNTGIAVTADVWYKLKVVVNASATSAGFYTGGTLRCSVTTNIPSGTARATGIVPIMILKAAGTTQRNVYLDYTYVKVALTTAR